MSSLFMMEARPAEKCWGVTSGIVKPPQRASSTPGLWGVTISTPHRVSTDGRQEGCTFQFLPSPSMQLVYAIWQEKDPLLIGWNP